MVDSALRAFGPEIWVSEGPVVSFYGFPYPTRMAVVRLRDGSLMVWSPIALSSRLARDVASLGTVRYLVSPNRLHHLFLDEWKSAHPEACLYASPGLRSKRRDLDFDGELGDRPDSAWAEDLGQVAVNGSFAMTEIVFFHHASRSAIFGDLIENLAPDWFSGWRGWLARLDGIVAPNPGAPREWRVSFLDRRATKAAVARILAWPIERVVLAHGQLASTDGAAFVRRAFTWLLGPCR